MREIKYPKMREARLKYWHRRTDGPKKTKKRLRKKEMIGILLTGVTDIEINTTAT